jgi:hypothetical protein
MRCSLPAGASTPVIPSEYLWRALAAFERPEHRNGQDATHVAELERLVGRLTLENDILKKATSILPQRLRPSGR